LPESARFSILDKIIGCPFMKSWQKALALALGLPSTILGIFLGFQEVVKAGYISQEWAQVILLLAVVLILIKMIQVSWKKK
jgi:uncharacterized membrane protein YfcA